MERVKEEPGQGEQPEQPGEGEQLQTGKYKSAIAEIKAELKSEFGKLPEDWSWTRDRKLPATLSREECQLLMTAYKKGKLAVRNNLIVRVCAPRHDINNHLPSKYQGGTEAKCLLP